MAELGIPGVLPIYTISFFCILSLLIDALIPRSSMISFHLSWIGFILTAAAALFSASDMDIVFSGMIVTGSYSAFFDFIFAIAGFLTVLSAHNYLEKFHFELDEFYSLTLLAVSGMIIIAHAHNFLVLFIGIEIMSIAFYILAAYMRNKALSVEAGLKYFLIGAFFSGFLMYGIALIYGNFASLDYGHIFERITQNNLNFPLLLSVGVLFLLVALSFKAAIFPFHFWVPDVYHGAPTVVTAMMSTGGKAAAFAAFLPIVFLFLPIVGEKIQLLLAILATFSMLYGNITAIVQQNVKRMLSYSSIAHAGYILIGVTAGHPAGFSAVAFYVVAYLFMQFGAFLVASTLESQYGKNLEISDYRGLGKRHPVLASCMAIFMLSLTGIPPLAGFFGKYYLFTAAIDAGFLWLAIIGVIASVISAYFYLGLIVAMFFSTEEPSTLPQPRIGIATVPLWLTTTMVFLLGIYPTALLEIAQQLF